MRSVREDLSRWSRVAVLLVFLAIIGRSGYGGELHPSIRSYDKPLKCQYLKETLPGSRSYILGEVFFLTWAQLDRIEKEFVFKKNGKEYRVPDPDRGYICTELVG